MFARSLPNDTAEANKTVALVICLLCSRKLSISQYSEKGREDRQKASVSSADCRKR